MKTTQERYGELREAYEKLLARNEITEKAKKEAIQMINKERNRLKNCNNKHARLMVRHNNLMQRYSELKDEYSALKIKHRHTVTKYNSITRLNERLRKELKGKLIKEEWTEVEKEREGTHGELQIYD